MGWDPQTGMWSPDESRQPLGALGAMMNFFNARRARDISGTLQDQREQRLAAGQQEMESSAFDLGERQRRSAEDQQMREAMAALPEDASPEQISSAYTRSGGDPSKTFPLMRTQESGRTRTGIERLKAAKLYVDTAQKQGRPPAQLVPQLKQLGYSDDEIDQMSQLGMLPKVEADINKTKADTALAGEKATDLRATRDARIQELRARSKELRDRVEHKVASGYKFGPKEKAAILTRIKQSRQALKALRNQTDPTTGMAKKLTAEDQADIRDTEADIGVLYGYLADSDLGGGESAPAAPAAPGSGVGALGLNLPPPPK